MQELSGRGETFRAAIAGFIEARREAKLKGKEDDADAGSKYDYAAWLTDAARRVGQIQAVTHVLKATHPDARGTSLHVVPSRLPQHTEIGSHLLGENFAEDVVGNAAALDVFKFLKVEVDGKRLLEWMQGADVDLRNALSDDEELAAGWMKAFASLVREESLAAVTHPMAKQVYWLAGDEPQDDTQYHLLQPMFSSSLMQVVHDDVRDARFGEANKEARQAFRDSKALNAPYRDYRNLVARKLGGTKPQNISQLNSDRGGVNYLLASLPPPAWRHSERTNLTKHDSALDVFLWFGNVRELVDSLRTFLRANPDRVNETREHRKVIEQPIVQELALFGVAVRAEYASGWTRSDDRDRPRCEQLWLDPDRVKLPDRNDPARPEWTQDDAAFRREYELDLWPDEVGARFGNWLNAQMRKAGELVAMAEPERNHWARIAAEAIRSMAWPIPLQRRAEGGGI
jgi:CRISPR-associated protein Csy1